MKSVGSLSLGFKRETRSLHTIQATALDSPHQDMEKHTPVELCMETDTRTKAKKRATPHNIIVLCKLEEVKGGFVNLGRFSSGKAHLDLSHEGVGGGGQFLDLFAHFLFTLFESIHSLGELLHPLPQIFHLHQAINAAMRTGTMVFIFCPDHQFIQKNKKTKNIFCAHD